MLFVRSLLRTLMIQMDRRHPASPALMMDFETRKAVMIGLPIRTEADRVGEIETATFGCLPAKAELLTAAHTGTCKAATEVLLAVYIQAAFGDE